MQLAVYDGANIIGGNWVPLDDNIVTPSASAQTSTSAISISKSTW